VSAPTTVAVSLLGILRSITKRTAGQTRQAKGGNTKSGLGQIVAQMRHRLLLQHAAGLNKETWIDRFVRYLYAVVGSELPLQPAGDLLRRPLKCQLLRDAPS